MPLGAKPGPRGKANLIMFVVALGAKALEENLGPERFTDSPIFGAILKKLLLAQPRSLASSLALTQISPCPG